MEEGGDVDGGGESLEATPATRVVCRGRKGGRVTGSGPEEEGKG